MYEATPYMLDIEGIKSLLSYGHMAYLQKVRYSPKQKPSQFRDFISKNNDVGISEAKLYQHLNQFRQSKWTWDVSSQQISIHWDCKNDDAGHFRREM